MTEPGKRNRNTIPLQIPTYWTPEQAFAVFELLDELRDAIWRCYALQLQEEYRDQIQHRPVEHDHIDLDDPPFDRKRSAENERGPVGPSYYD